MCQQQLWRTLFIALHHTLWCADLLFILQMLVESFNVAAANNVMCRNTVNVGWDGRIFDCDFNQQLDMGMRYSCSTNAACACPRNKAVCPLLVP